MIGNGSIKPIATKEGGAAVYLINKTGAPSIKGTLVNTESLINNAVNIVDGTIDEPDIVGVIYQDGVPDGEMVLVVYSGIAEVLIEDGTTSTAGYWVRTSENEKGRADITLAAPPGGTITAINSHFRECGHSLETKEAGVDVLAKIMMHFN